MEEQDAHWIAAVAAGPGQTFSCVIDRSDSRCLWYRHVGIRRNTDRNDELAYSVAQLVQKRISDGTAGDGMGGMVAVAVAAALIRFARYPQ